MAPLDSGTLMPVPRSSLLLSFVAFFLVLAGCTPGNNLLMDDPQLVASPDRVSLMLAESADRASSALETLAAIEQAKAEPIAVPPITSAPPEMRRAVTVNWVGPPGPLVKTLADRAGYTFAVFGTAPATPDIVSIDSQNRPVVDILRDVGLQLGRRADISVDGARKRIELHYVPVTANSGF